MTDARTQAPEKGEERQEAAEIRLRADDETDSSLSSANVVECCGMDMDQDPPNTVLPKCSEVATRILLKLALRTIPP